MPTTTLPVAVIEPDAHDPIGRLGRWLTEAGLALTVIRPYAGDSARIDLDAYRALVVLGGHQCSHDGSEAPWLDDVRGVLRDALRRQVPVLGICLGAQLLAQAAGGAVAANPDGPEYGARLIAKRSAAAADPIFGPVAITPDVVQWHRDAVVALPPDAELIAASPGCEVEVFRVGALAWGVQSHPEATPQLVADWIELAGDALVDYDIGALLARVEEASDDVVEAWRPVAEAFARVVEDPQVAIAALASGAAGGRGATGPTHIAGPVTDPAQIRAMLAAEAQAARPVPIDLTRRPEQQDDRG